MNGVARGGFYSTSQVLNVRCGGLRWERVRTYAGDRVGFRLAVNGVWRGGQYAGNSYSARGSCRSGGYVRSMRYASLGFRFWCNKG